ncbi:carboxypeptidase-like regulatory domain-containing protein [Niabella ginsengisoli]|uniref:Carboxypeptidase-like regulatory domain-containing protein n=1 Tax=Niabella ginsengisoli TaxID=522298 RepID=A0ABS9SHM1_9BACT|nr:carboxypeptidase-like regulatory domain-containing protein [Niabella ginsengisoli]MCH5597868.1 carboxypeptidase-like regulatory domain-containing protein [Niabella ginsengisoli]
MKLGVALMLVTSLQVAANTGHGQETVSLNVENTRLSKVLKSIQKKTDYRFVFNNTVVDDIGTVNIAVNNIPVLDLLPRILKGTNLEFVQMRNNLIVIREGKNIKSQASSVIAENNGLVARQADIKVNGLVTDSSGSILSGVSVALKATPSIGTTTDLNGRYVLEVPANGTLVFSITGYLTQEIPIDGKESINVVMKKMCS